MMLSRVADSLYWMGRYTERAENGARLLQIASNTGLEGGTDEGALCASRALRAFGVPPLLAEGLTLKDVGQYALHTSNPISLAASIGSARENARQVRDQLTTEMWQRLNRLHFLIRAQQANRDHFLRDMHENLEQIIEGLNAFRGATYSTMQHNEGFQILTLGVAVERLQAVVQLCDIHLSLPTGQVGEYGWSQALRMCCGLEPYVRVNTANFNRGNVMEFLILSADFPRALRHVATVIFTTIDQLWGRGGNKRFGEALRLAGKLRATLDFVAADELSGKAALQLVRLVAQEAALVHEALIGVFLGQADHVSAGYSA